MNARSHAPEGAVLGRIALQGGVAANESKIARLPEAPTPPVHGSVMEKPLPLVLAMMETGSRTGVLRLWFEDRAGEVWFERGRLLCSDGLEPAIDALVELLGWHDAKYEAEFGVRRAGPSAALPLSAVLPRAKRRLETRSLLLAGLPHPSTRFMFEPSTLEPDEVPEGLDSQVASLFDGSRSMLEVLAHFPSREPDAAAGMMRLYTRGALIARPVAHAGVTVPEELDPDRVELREGDASASRGGGWRRLFDWLRGRPEDSTPGMERPALSEAPGLAPTPTTSSRAPDAASRATPSAGISRASVAAAVARAGTPVGGIGRGSVAAALQLSVRASGSIRMPRASLRPELRRSNMPTMQPTLATVDVPWLRNRAALGEDSASVLPRLLDAVGIERESCEEPRDRLFLRKLEDALSGGQPLPPFPAIARDLDRLLRSDDPPLADAVALVSQDRDLEIRVQRAASAAAYGRSVNGLDRAVTRIGFDRLWRLAVESLLHIPEFQARALRPQMMAVRRIAHVTSELAATLGSRAHRNEHYLGGLLHEIGRLYLYRVAAPERGTEGPNADRVESVASAYQSSIGVVLAEHWGLGPLVIDAIAHHADAEGEDTPCGEAAKAVRIAQIVTHGASLGTHMDPHDIADAVRGVPGLEADPVALLARARSAFADLAEAPPDR